MAHPYPWPPFPPSPTLMQPTIQMAKLRSEKAIDQPTQLQSGSILDVPTELLLRVIAFLSPSSIRSLIVNRSLRSICEKALYRSISLPGHPRRSIRLLETFLLRPDLALLVRHLEIDLSWRHPWISPLFHIPSALKPYGLEALCLAKNIHSLSLEGDWLWDPEMAKLREAIFKMKLGRLEISVIRDEDLEFDCIMYEDSDGEEQACGGREAGWDQDLGNEIRTLLQAQPLLEELKLSFSDFEITSATAEGLQANLQASDVPSIKSLQAPPEVALAFLQVAPRLERLNLTVTIWNNTLLSKMETHLAAIKLSIRRFGMRVWAHDNWVWSNLAKVFLLFPNTEELSVIIDSPTRSKKVELAKSFFGQVVDSVYVLPSLRKIEVKFENPYSEDLRIPEVEIKSIIDCKAACPLLETVIEPARRLWTFRPDSRVLSGFAAHLVGPLIEASLGPLDDLPDRKSVV